MLLIFEILVTVACLGMLVNAAVNTWALRQDWRRARRQRLPEPPPMISVCVPARNEARNIEACALSLARQDYPSFEVLILDDCSQDETAAIAERVAARHPNVRVLRGRPLEPGWIGKPHACRQLGEAARGGWLLFTDADTEFAPDALRNALKLGLALRADLLSGFPAMEVRTLPERLSVPLLSLMGAAVISFPMINRIRWHLYAAASGAFLFFRRGAYEKIGGHGAVRDKIVEDVEIARAIKKAGLRNVFADATQIVRCRMYTNWREVWEGFTKNFNSAFPGGQALIVVVAFWALLVLPWILFVFGSAWALGLWTGTLLPLTQVVVLSWMRAWLDRKLGSPDLLGLLLMPLGGIFFSLIALRSWSRSILRQPTPWRAREYELWKK